jgi:HCOMODA/2-hydroxy-3-carboxy-muconic semialdehyde decarboxylase
MRAMYHMASFVAAGVPVWDIRDAIGVSDMLVSEGKAAASLAAALGDRAAVLMRGHGAVVVANSLPNVVGRSVYLDVNARAQVQAATLGGSVRGVAPTRRASHVRSQPCGRAWS